MRAVRGRTSDDGAAWRPGRSARPRLGPRGESLSQPGDITGLLGYRLHAIVARIASVVIRLCEGRYGISRREWHVLGLLDTRGPQTPSQLADQCHLDRPRISRAIAALDAKGLLARLPAARDRKRVLLALTPSGRELQRRVFADVSAINARLVEGFDGRQLEQLELLLARLGAKADAVARDAASEVRADLWRGYGGRRHWSRGRGAA